MPSIIPTNGDGYAPKMDQGLTDAVSKWWSGLTKEELLQYLGEQPSVTADDLRRMLANENVTLAFGIHFATSNQSAVTDFHSQTN